jgi:hypothetical protein
MRRSTVLSLPHLLELPGFHLKGPPLTMTLLVIWPSISVVIMCVEVNALKELLIEGKLTMQLFGGKGRFYFISKRMKCRWIGLINMF